MTEIPHNSGHFTIEACDFNQFDLHIKGILGEDLPEPKLLNAAITVKNISTQSVPESFNFSAIDFAILLASSVILSVTRS